MAPVALFIFCCSFPLEYALDLELELESQLKLQLHTPIPRSLIYFEYRPRRTSCNGASWIRCTEKNTYIGFGFGFGYSIWNMAGCFPRLCDVRLFAKLVFVFFIFFLFLHWRSWGSVDFKVKGFRFSQCELFGLLVYKAWTNTKL